MKIATENGSLIANVQDSSSIPGIQKFLARQPIFDRHHSVYGYELLFRSGLDNYFLPEAKDTATQSVVNNSLLIGIDSLTGVSKAFINFTHQGLVESYPTLLPSRQLVVEVLEDVRPDGEVIQACHRLKQAGYLIALDDFVFGQNGNPLIELADIIKVDFLLNTPDQCRQLARHFARRGTRLVAEKIETQEEAASALAMGYAYFQGYFYCKPQLLTTRDVPSFKLNYLRILQAINREPIDLNEVEGILHREPSLLIKLLRYLNSPYFGLRGRVSSIRHALTLLGEKNLRKWTSVVALVDLAQEKPSELIFTALVRARFCEMLAPHLGLKKHETDLFLLGLLSVMDAVLDRDLTEVLQDMPLATEIKAALLGNEHPYRDILESSVAHEKGDWVRFRACIERLGLDEDRFPDLYVPAVQWVSEIFKI